jgi:hypothetical protein
MACVRWLAHDALMPLREAVVHLQVQLVGGQPFARLLCETAAGALHIVICGSDPCRVAMAPYNSPQASAFCSHESVLLVCAVARAQKPHANSAFLYEYRPVQFRARAYERQWCVDERIFSMHDTSGRNADWFVRVSVMHA